MKTFRSGFKYLIFFAVGFIATGLLSNISWIYEELTATETDKEIRLFHQNHGNTLTSDEFEYLSELSDRQIEEAASENVLARYFLQKFIMWGIPLLTILSLCFFAVYIYDSRVFIFAGILVGFLIAESPYSIIYLVIFLLTVAVSSVKKWWNLSSQ